MASIIDWVSTHIPPWVWITLVIHFAILGTVAYLILLERKTASWVQDRLGPNRVGLGFGIIPWLKDKHMFGLGQPLADGIKFIVKEDYQPAGVDKILFSLAPMMMIVVIIISIAALPWGGVKQGVAISDAHVPAGSTIIAHGTDGSAIYQWKFQIASLNIGVLYILAVLSLAVYGVVIGGWASNNKYSFLGGLRATANMISYEVPLGLAVLTIALMYGTLDLEQIVDKQACYWAGWIPAWNVFTQPLAFVMFLICIHAEANRAPFDLAEAEQELVGGYHTEYSAMRFALFFLGEYAGMVTTSAVCVALFFGGWHLPWIEWLWKPLAGNVDPAHPEITTSLIACIIRSLIFFGKTIAIIFVFMWVRWSLPRFRFDQLMGLAWRALIPIAMTILLVTAIVIYYFGGHDDRDASMRINGKMALVLLAANVVMMFGFVIASFIIPAAPATNRKMKVSGSRFQKTPLPAALPSNNYNTGNKVMKDSDIKVLSEPKLSIGDQFYLPQVLLGLGTTMKHMLHVLAGTDRVIQYPEEKREDLPIEKGGMNLRTYRGVHRLNKDEDGRVKCVACFMCSTACPARCIHIEAEESPWQDREKYPRKFDIDELRCIYCGMCEEACPVDAIELTHVYDIVGLTRQEMIFDKEKLLQVYDQTVKDEPM